MIRIEEVVKEMKLEVLSGAKKLNSTVTGAYSSDLLSDVMGRAMAGEVWITMQTHKNIIAVASLKELSAILIVNGGKPDAETIALAESEGIAILGTGERCFRICGILYKILERNALV